MIIRVVSGGQTGVDRAALDAALGAGLPVGGWCPRGRLAEDGSIPPCYPLQETPTSRYRERTEWNVRDSDGTLVLTIEKPSQGTALTLGLARKLGRPHFVVDLREPEDPRTSLDRLREGGVRILNVAGPRESTHPGIYRAARAYLEALFALTAPPASVKSPLDP